MNGLEKFRDSKYIFVVGIGGSDLASRAVWNAMTLHKPNLQKKMFFLESPDAREYEEVSYFVQNTIATPEEAVLIVVSKSGKTEETLRAFHKTFEILSEKFGMAIHQRAVVISSPDTPLWKLAEEKSMERLEWEGGIGGRFSAFSIAHTFALSLAGLDTERFLNGKGEINKADAEKLAQNVFENYKKGLEILDIFIFNSELEDLGKWCRQLIAESLATITPTVSLGPTDLHSMLELYLEKPKSRFTIFVRSKKEIGGGANEKAYNNIVEEYGKRELPFYKYEMPEINEYQLGSFMAFMIKMVIELSKLLGVNPYDQPEVENYKNSLHNS